MRSKYSFASRWAGIWFLPVPLQTPQGRSFSALRAMPVYVDNNGGVYAFSATIVASTPEPIPEPGTVGMAIAGLPFLGAWHKSRTKKASLTTLPAPL